MSDNVIDIITRQVVEKLGPELESRAAATVQAVTNRVEQEARDRIDAVVADIPRIAIRAAEQAQQVPGELVLDDQLSAKSDAKDRAWRTLVQGLVVTVVLAAVTAFGTAISSESFDLATWDSWKTAATAAGTAVMISITAYIQRLVSPPKAEWSGASALLGR